MLQQFINCNSGFPSQGHWFILRFLLVCFCSEIWYLTFNVRYLLPVWLIVRGSSLPCNLTFLVKLRRALDFSVCLTNFRDKLVQSMGTRLPDCRLKRGQSKFLVLQKKWVQSRQSRQKKDKDTDTQDWWEQEAFPSNWIIPLVSLCDLTDSWKLTR